MPRSRLTPFGSRLFSFRRLRIQWSPVCRPLAIRAFDSLPLIGRPPLVRLAASLQTTPARCGPCHSLRSYGVVPATPTQHATECTSDEERATSRPHGKRYLQFRSAWHCSCRIGRSVPTVFPLASVERGLKSRRASQNSHVSGSESAILITCGGWFCPAKRSVLVLKTSGRASL